MPLVKARYWLYKKAGTADGHLAYIHCKRNALLFARHTYIVSIMSKEHHKTSDGGCKRAVIYGWEDADINRLLREVYKWTIKVMLDQNKSLLEAARNYVP